MAQSGNLNDSLKKYSYLLAVYKDTVGKWYLQGITTGFFVRDSGQLYLVTAYHTFTQTSVVPGTPSNMKLDVMRLRVFHPEFGMAFFNIDLRKVKDRGKIISLYTSPDVYAVKITDTNFLKVPVNTINDILSVSKDKTGSEIRAISFGFPYFEKEGKIDFTTYKDSMYVGGVASKKDYIRLNEFNGIDSLNTVLAPCSYNGASGSPVFYIYSKTVKGNKKEWVEFAGLMSASNPTYNFCAIVKKEFVLAKLKYLFSQH